VDLFNSRDLDILIEEVTVRCVGDEEQRLGFGTAFERAVRYPFSGTVIGHDVDVLAVRWSTDRRELVAECAHGGRRYEVALLDVEPLADPATVRLVEAYRRWAST
jgi:hypothetical protein